MKVATFQKGVESKTTILSEIEMGYAAGKVNRFAGGANQLLSSEIFDAETQMMKHLVLETLTTEIQPWLREKRVDGSPRIH